VVRDEEITWRQLGDTVSSNFDFDFDPVSCQLNVCLWGEN
jgi:hypothetical protein